MRHLKLLVGLLVITLGVSPAAADLLLFDFEEFDSTSERFVHPGALSVLISTQQDVTLVITRTGNENFDVVECPQPDFNALWGGRAIDPWYGWDQQPVPDWFVATFSTPMVYVELQMTDFGQDDDTAFMEVYEGPNGAGPLLAAVDQHWGTASSPDFASISYAADPGQSFQSILFRGYSTLLANSMYVDNLAVVPVPEPATAALVGLGAIGLFLRRRKR